MKLEDIVRDFAAYMDESPNPRSDWYVGITSDPEERVFRVHRVPRATHPCIIGQADSADDARIIEQAFLDTGCDGAPGGGVEDATFVYAYLKAEGTAP